MDERLHRRRGAGLSFLMGGDGEPLLLLHGVPGSAQTWQKVGVKIASRFRVIIPDLMGFGASDPPADDFFVEAHAHAIHALLQYLQIKSLYLGGHGFGAAVAVTFMRLYPEIGVRGLILAAADLFADTPMPWLLRLAHWPLLNQVAIWGIASNRVGLRVLYEATTQHKDEALWRDFRQHLTGGTINQTRRIVQRTLADNQAAHAEIAAVLPAITCPTLLLWGDEDPLVPVVVGERARALLPDALLKVYAYTGHFVPEERPIECAEDIALRFTDHPLIIKS